MEYDHLEAPRAAPLRYPGARPETAVLVTEDEVIPLTASGNSIGDFIAESDPAQRRVGTILVSMNQPAITKRTPVVAIGSNASPAQLRHKALTDNFTLPVPVMRGTMRGASVGYAPFISRFGYFPATIVLSPEAQADVSVLFLTDDQLVAMDATEVGYRHLTLDNVLVSVQLSNGAEIHDARLYVAAGGFLADEEPLALGDQAELLEMLIRSSRRLRRLLGETPSDVVFNAGVGDDNWREDVQRALRVAGWIDGEDQLAGVYDVLSANPYRKAAREQDH